MLKNGNIYNNYTHQPMEERSSTSDKGASRYGKGTGKGGKMKIDLKEFNGIVRDYLHGVGIEHFSTAVSYGGDRIKSIMIIPGAENKEITGDEFGDFGIIGEPQEPSLVKSQTELQNTIDLYENAYVSRTQTGLKSLSE